jgi:hypothetical protein
MLQKHHDRGIATLVLADERVDPPQAVTEGHIDGIHL